VVGWIIELLDYCRANQATIYVRAKRRGGYENVSLAEATTDEVLEHLGLWIRTGAVPIRVIGTAASQNPTRSDT